MYENIKSEVLKKIKPSLKEKKELQNLANHILKKIDEIALEHGLDAFGALVGSVARDTWTSGDRDLDIFIMLPPSLLREELEHYGLLIAKKISKEYEERYAEHPYIHAKFGDFDVDLVPCFNVKDASKIKSAVDRTPFHNAYIKKHISSLEDEVLLLKQFMRGCGVYGAELKLQGFSGYLCELLVIRYGSFLDVIKKASEWKYGELMDLERCGVYQGDCPLIFIDPVDPKRNVAAAVSIDTFSRFIDASRSFLENPRINYFFPKSGFSIPKKELKKIIDRRGTEFVSILFDIPEIVDDILYPQLYKAEKSIISLINRHGFRVFGSSVCAKENKAIIFLEMEVFELPKIKKHFGPPVTSKNRAKDFLDKHKSTSTYIEDGKYVSEIKRRYTNVFDLLENKLLLCALGKNVSNYVENGYKLIKNEKVLNEGFEEFIGAYFSSKHF